MEEDPISRRKKIIFEFGADGDGAEIYTSTPHRRISPTIGLLVSDKFFGFIG